ncbi:9597_t:CDS:2, partial [Gigaspora rosea]
DEKKVVEQDLDYVKGGESFVGPKLVYENRLVFDKGKIIDKNVAIVAISNDSRINSINNTDLNMQSNNESELANIEKENIPVVSAGDDI